MEDNARTIVKKVIEESQYIFKSFNDPKIEMVEDELRFRGIDYITTSQTGMDFVIAIKGSSFYRKFHSK